ncbi:EamA family transporter [Uliginosibacterium aquaticum]|uniref:DMT family transporter n=1 Tax=Uliginosibacterium aquaticum TaxID=2731212 RepID=A0ABX2IGX7_9RHOO|nr:DMT family transporter [Uliginosibacterium aquaticum]NSL55971.1 DMT family transporter [Uliginosibacterium aquaticum]
MHPSASRPSLLLSVLALLGSMAALCIGSSFAKHLFPLIGAAGTTAWRLTGSALLLALLWRPWRDWPARAELGRVLQYGAALGAMNLSFYLALRSLPLGVCVAIELTGPLAVALLSARRAGHFVWVLLAALGIVLLLNPFAHGAWLDPVGVGFAVLAAVFWALYILAGKRVSHLHAGLSVSLGMLTAAALVVPFGAWSAGPQWFSPSVALWGLGVALLSSALPYSLEMIALRGLTTRAFGTLVSLEPAIGALAGFVILGERLTGLQWLAIAAVMAACAGTVGTAARD